jgi:phosphoglycolate phosphatase-like HAD superfamily hydrolase
VNDAPVDVILLDVPVALWSRSRSHSDAVRAAAAEGDAPARLAEITERFRERYDAVAETALSELRAATVRRVQTVDLAYPVPRRARDDVDAFLAALESADEWARTSGRDDLVTPPDVAAFRRWYFGEIANQMDGGFPTPWRGA